MRIPPRFSAIRLVPPEDKVKEIAHSAIYPIEGNYYRVTGDEFVTAKEASKRLVLTAKILADMDDVGATQKNELLESAKNEWKSIMANLIPKE